MVNIRRQLLLEKVDLLSENKQENFDLKSIIDLIAFLNQNQSSFPEAKVQRNTENYLKGLIDNYRSVNNENLIETFGVVQFYKKQIFNQLNINFKKDKEFLKQFLSDIFDESTRDNLNNAFNMYNGDVSVYEILSIIRKETRKLEERKKSINKQMAQVSKAAMSKELDVKHLSQTEPGKYFDYRDSVSDKDKGATQDFDSIRSSKSEDFQEVEQSFAAGKQEMEQIDKTIDSLREKTNLLVTEEKKVSSTNKASVFSYLQSLVSKKSKEDGGNSIRQTISNLGSIYIDCIEFQDLYSQIRIKNENNVEEKALFESIKEDRWIMISLKENSLKLLSKQVNKDSENQSVLEDYLNQYQKANNNEIYNVRLEKMEELDIERLRSFMDSFNSSGKSLFSKATDEKTDDDINFEQIQKFFFDTNSQIYTSVEEQIRYYLIMLAENREQIIDLMHRYLSKKITSKSPKVNWNQVQYRKYSYLDSDRYEDIKNKILLLQNPFDEIKEFEEIVSNFQLKNKLSFTFFRPLVMFFIFLDFYKNKKLDNLDEVKKGIVDNNWIEDFKIALNLKEGYQIYSSKTNPDKTDLKILSVLQDFILGKFRFKDREGNPDGDSSMKEAKDFLVNFMKKHGDNFDRELFTNIISINTTRKQYIYAQKDEADKVEEILNKEKARVAKLLRPMLWSYMLDRYRDLNLLETQRMFYQLILVFEKAITDFRFDYENEEYKKAAFNVPAYREYASLFMDNPEDPDGPQVAIRSKFVNYLFYKLEEFRKNKSLNYYSNQGNTKGHNKTKQEKDESTAIVSSRYLYARPINDVDLSELVNTLLSVVRIEQVPVYTNVDKLSKRGRGERVRFNITTRERVDYRMVLKDSLLKDPESLLKKLKPINKFLKEDLELKLEDMLKQKKINRTFFDYVPAKKGQQKSSNFQKTSKGMKRVASTRDINPVEIAEFSFKTTPYFDALIHHFDEIKSILRTFELSNGEIISGLFNSTKNNIQLSGYTRNYVYKVLEWIIEGQYENITDFIKTTLDFENVYNSFKVYLDDDLEMLKPEQFRIFKKIKSQFIKSVSSISPLGIADFKNKKDLQKHIENALNFVQNLSSILENIFVYLHDLANQSLDNYKENITSKNLHQKEYDQKKTVYNEDKLSNIVIGVLDMLKEKYIAAGLGSTLNVKTALYRMQQGKLMPDFEGYKTVGHLSTGATSELHPFVDVSSDQVDVNKKFLRLFQGPEKYDKSQIGDRKARAIAAQINAQYRLLYSIQEGNDNLEDINRKMTNRIHSEVSAEFTKSQRKQFFMNSTFTNYLFNRINRAIFAEFFQSIQMRGFNFDSPTWFLENDLLRNQVLYFVAQKFIIPIETRKLNQYSDKFGQPTESDAQKYKGMNLKYTNTDLYNHEGLLTDPDGFEEEARMNAETDIDKLTSTIGNSAKNRKKKISGNNDSEGYYKFDTRKAIEDLPQVIDQPKGIKTPVVSQHPRLALLEKIVTIQMSEFAKYYPQYLENKNIYNKEHREFIDEDIKDDIESNKVDLFEELHDMSTKDKINNLNKVVYRLDEMLSKDMFKPYRSESILQNEFSGELYKQLEANLTELNKVYEANAEIIRIAKRFLHAKNDKIRGEIVKEFKNLNIDKETYNLLIKFYNKINNLGADLNADFDSYQIGTSSEILGKNTYSKEGLSNRTTSVLLEFLHPIVMRDTDPGWGPLVYNYNQEDDDELRLLTATIQHLKKDVVLLNEILGKTKKDIKNIEDNKKILSKMSEDDAEINKDQLNILLDKLKSEIENSPYTSKVSFEKILKQLPRDEVKYKVMSEKLLYAYLQYVYTREFVQQQVLNEYVTIMNDDSEFFLTEKNKNKIYTKYFGEINHLPCIEFDYYIGEKGQYKSRSVKNKEAARHIYSELKNIIKITRDDFENISNNIINYLLGISDFTFSADIVTGGIKKDSTTQSDIAGADVLVGTTNQENSILSKLQKQIYNKYGLINIRKKISNFVEAEEFKHAMRGHSSLGPTVAQLKYEAKNISRFTIELAKYMVSIKRIPHLKQHLKILQKELSELKKYLDVSYQDQVMLKNVKNKEQAEKLKLKIKKDKEAENYAVKSEDQKKKEEELTKKIAKNENQQSIIDSEIARVEAYEENIDKNYMNLVTKSLRMFIRAMVNLAETGPQAPPLSDQFSSYNELMNKITNPPKIESTPPIKLAQFLESCIAAVMSENNQNRIYQSNVIDVIKSAYGRLISIGDIHSLEMNDEGDEGEVKVRKEKDKNIYSTKVSPKENQESMINELNELKDSSEKLSILVEKFNTIYNKITSYLQTIKLPVLKTSISKSHKAIVSSVDEKSFKNKLEKLIAVIQKQKFPETISESKFHDLLMIDNAIKKIIKLISNGPNDNVKRYELARLREGAVLMLRLSTIPSYNYDKYKIFLGNESMKNNYVIEFTDSMNKTFEDRKYLWIIPKQTVS